MGKRKKHAKAKATPRIGRIGWSGGGGWNSNGDYVMGADIKTIHPLKRVLVINPGNITGAPLADVPAMGLDMDWRALVRQHGSTTVHVKGSPPVEEVRVLGGEAFLATVDTNTKAWKKKPMMCVYDAVKNYCRDLLGVSFSSEDSTFFEEHPLVDVDGVPFPHTLRVVQELIDPYRLRISRVQIATHYNIKGDVLQWRRVLGCNPLALNDRATTNAQFEAQVGVPGVYGFEYNETSLTPSISCGTAWAAVPGVTTGSSGGHAMFIPPRRRTGAGLLSFQIDHAANVVWKKPPVFDPVPEPTPILIEAFDLNAWYKVHGTVYTSTKGTSVATTKPVPDTRKKQWEFHPDECYNCETPTALTKHTRSVPGLCDACWELLCSLFYCSTITCVQGQVEIPTYASYVWEEGRIYTRCPSCANVAWVDKTYGQRVIRALQALHSYDIDLKISCGLDANAAKTDEAVSPAPPPESPPNAAPPTNVTPTPDDPFDGMSGWGD